MIMMLLKDLGSLENFIALERYVNKPKYSPTALISEVGKEYHPRNGNSTFLLPYHELKQSEVEIITACPGETARLAVQGESPETIKFFVHPIMQNEIFTNQKPNRVVEVAPSSSTRTVIFTKEHQGLMVKLHLNKRISRFIRRLKASSIEHSIMISRELETIIKNPRTPTHFAFLPESIGIIRKAATPDETIGYLIRESTPRPYIKETRFIIPFFALTSPDTRSLNDAPLLIQMGKYLHRDPFNILIEEILDPFLSVWAYIFLRYGILLEAHGQNTLLEINDNYEPKRIVHRDFQSTPIDPGIRKKRKISTQFTKHVIGQGDYPARLEQSLMYDHFVGDYLFSSLEEFSYVYLNRSHELFRNKIRALFNKYIPEQNQYFPQGHTSFKGGIMPDNTYCLDYKDEPPLYR
ncbi:hypothetical protein HY967_01300 [Candidatus Jorgensenbacteria bacterium]|nr:hypothetical protein [Candidatus Jorgensenbacteria bacterium]